METHRDHWGSVDLQVKLQWFQFWQLLPASHI